VEKMIHNTFQYKNASILIWEITEAIDELKALLINFSVYEPEFSALKTDKRKLEFLTARVAFNVLAAKEIIVKYNPEGKPICFDTDLNISISHSGKWIAVMLHPTYAVGIDIEMPTNKFEKVYKRFLSNAEQLRFYSGDDFRKIQLAWSTKEALYKIIGAEAVNFDKQLEILDFEILSSGVIYGFHTPTAKRYELEYQQNELFNLVYCIAN